MNAGENEFLYKLVPAAQYPWTGGHRETSDGPWTWSDNTSWDYVNWLEGFNVPDGFPNNHCVRLNSLNSRYNGQLYNEKCSGERPSLCKYSL